MSNKLILANCILKIYVALKRYTLIVSTQKSLKVKGWENLYQENIKQKKAQETTSMSDKVDLKTKSIIRQKRNLMKN